MKLYPVLLLMLCVLLPASCGKTQKTEEAAADTLPPDETIRGGIVEMASSHFEDTVTWRGKVYRYSITKKPDATLPRVKEEETGALFADNHIDLTITQAGKEVFKRRFFKTSFDSYLDAGFKQKGILEGLVFDLAVPEGLQFATSICYPRSDLYIPLILIIHPDGGMTIKRDNIMDADVEDVEGV